MSEYESQVDWHKRFFDLAKYVGTWSKDRSKGVGAVIVDNDGRVLSMGYNGFPSGCNDDVDSRYERPAKYMYTEHSERNAIYSAAKNGIILKNSNIYISLYPCIDCARAIIQSGIKTVTSTKPDFEHERWGESFKVSKEMFDEVGVHVEYVEE